MYIFIIVLKKIITTSNNKNKKTFFSVLPPICLHLIHFRYAAAGVGKVKANIDLHRIANCLHFTNRRLS